MLWIALIGAVTWIVPIVFCYRERHPHPDACPDCGHEAGLTGSQCSEVEHVGGWSSYACRCENDYHRNYVAV